MNVSFVKNFTGVFIIMLLWVVTGCIKKDLYDPNNGKEQLLPESEYFGFETRGNVALNVNYDLPGFHGIVEVYAQDPLEKRGGNYVKKEGLPPIYSAYTDNGKLKAMMYIPMAVKEAYLYSDRWGAPQCVKLEATADGFAYDATKLSSASVTKSSTRSPYSYVIGDKAPYSLVGNQDNLYALGRFDINGCTKYVPKPWVPDCVETDYTAGYVTETKTFKNEALSTIIARVQNFFDQYNGSRSELLKGSEITNIKVVEAGALDVVFLAERAAYNNTFGYYYYEADKAPRTEADFRAMKKYVIAPNVEDQGTFATLPGYTFRLKYFGKNGDSDATEIFPKNTVIGWFLVSNGFTMNSKIAAWNQFQRNYFFSNDEGANQRFVSIVDSKTGMVVLGCEDQISPDPKTEDYSDILFFVKSDAKLDNEDKPVIPEEKPEEKPGTEIITGTLAFEDIWPTGGDYDLNDVVLEYSREITYNGKNYATQIVETFTPVHNGATSDNFFAYQVKHKGNITLPEGCSYEVETQSIRIDDCVKKLEGHSFVIIRQFGENEVNKDDLKTDFNPYIIVKAYFGQNRKEVHLPKHLATDLADDHLTYTENDAYFIDKNGKYPFALDIPVCGFKVAEESIRIDSDTEYPAFKIWADSKGAQEQEWYIKK